MSGGGPESSDNNQYIIPNVERALKILEYLTREQWDASITEIVEQFSLPKNSVFRIMKSLEYYGYVEEIKRRYHATPRLLYLGYGGINSRGIVESSIESMLAIRKKTNETVLLGKLIGDNIVILEQLPSQENIKFSTEVGQRVPVHASAPGKAFVAFLPVREQKEILSTITFTRYTDQTIPSRSALIAEIQRIGTAGYAVDECEGVEGVVCIASVIFDYRHYPIASIWVTGPEYRMRKKGYDLIGSIVVHEARAVSEQFGYVHMTELPE